MDLLAQMETFIRVVEAKSLSAAARSLGLSLPAVSRQLRALEEDLGASLIARSTRKLTVTDAGREWYAHCQRVLREVDAARAALRGGSKVRGTLVVSASVTFGSTFVLPRLDALLQRYPELAVELRLEDRVVDLIGESVDVALRAGPPPPDSTAFVAHPLATMRRIVVAAPRWLRKHGTVREPEQLAHRPCLIQVALGGAVVPWTLRCATDDDTSDTSDTSADARERVVHVSGRIRTNTPLALRDLAVRGLGIALLPEWLVQPDIAARRLRRVLPDWASPPLTAWAIHRSELRGAPRIRALLEALRSD